MDFTAIIATVAAISGIVLGWAGRTRSFKRDVAQEAGAEAVQRVDVEYIKRGVDDIRADLRMQGQRVDGLSERVTRVEESAKQAHKRLDRLEE
ncbi:hypothetical protein [Paenibacillus apiarius]|uniref:Uncharacterized protein n=1 Tax=Paenibacillus apiarius TaxID=46240 RepID=A0ABT4DUB4_9BACL|nr:hypothetical protein [Paenibacillus apiarius]MCY9513325.1 hypothetical protein [Paenibacillus apiarius]MCY9519703.1 hypothetical protein [Paenibacillus apiarius]MCY9553241.1 hypothetical protein [Paenibacillus apiarius]MCY9557091.1 hypothetical protein [Paenibacillus apiarius]MCY9682168.1 hypothetical protein [Paenibacillus apiarius]